MKPILFFYLVFIFYCIGLSAQTFTLSGEVIDRASRRPVAWAGVQVVGTAASARADSSGVFRLSGLAPGIFRLQVTALGYRVCLTPEYEINHSTPYVHIELERADVNLEGVTVTTSSFRKTPQSPVSLRTIGVEEIEKSPGANRDISKVVQQYPGVAFSPVGYRNDLIVRGGGPSENRFSLDGIEIPNINHFSTQGASGGPVGLIDADLIRQVNFYSSAFPVDRGNALSSVLDFSLRDGNMEDNNLKATLGASEVALTSSGHLGKKTSYLVSVRQSYLQLLFKALGLPFLPAYTDASFKLKTRFDAHHELTVLGLGGLDRMSLNLGVTGDEAEYMLSYLPVIRQQTYTVGGVYRHYGEVNVQTVTLSHSSLQGKYTKYRNNDDSRAENLTLDIRPHEQSSHLRMDNTATLGWWKLRAGAELSYIQYGDDEYRKYYASGQQTDRYHTRLLLPCWALYAALEYRAGDERMTASLGVRADANNYNEKMRSLSRQLSPRLSVSYRLRPELSLSFHTGLYYQLPPNTALGYQDAAGYAVNRRLDYQRVSQYTLGISWNINPRMECSAEGFYKDYARLPLSVTDGIPLSCKGNDYGLVGNEALVSQAGGRAYGLEVLYRWLVAGKLHFNTSFTLFRSEFRRNRASAYLPAAWDNRFIFNMGGTYHFSRSWSAGLRMSCIGGAPYTPYDEEKSSLVEAWDVQGRAYPDYSRYNAERLPAYARVDIRVDKTFYWRKCMLGVYVDVQNLTDSKLRQQDALLSTGQVANPSAPESRQRYVMKRVKQWSGTVLPTLGVTFEY